MTLKDIINGLTWEQFKLGFKELYPEDDEDPEQYDGVFKYLKETAPDPYDCRIAVTKEEEEGEERGNISGVGVEDGVYYSLMMVPWRNWLGMEIHWETLENFRREQIAAACMWEMTFHGFTAAAVEGFIQSLIDAVENTKNTPYNPNDYN